MRSRNRHTRITDTARAADVSKAEDMARGAPIAGATGAVATAAASARPPEVCSVRPRIDKLGVKPGYRVAIVGVEDPALLVELSGRGAAIVPGWKRSSCDVVFYAAETLASLDRLPDLKSAIVPNGAIWVVSKKGKERSLNDTDVIAAAKHAGLVDNKVVSFSPTHTALRLVIPLALRQG